MDRYVSNFRRTRENNRITVSYNGRNNRLANNHNLLSDPALKHPPVPLFPRK